jgi:hypothetical protein
VATAREELEQVQKNPHAEWLRETLALARIRYGRIDYGLLNGKPQVWEINTNPTIIRPAAARPLPEEQIRLRDPVRQVFFPSLQAAIEAIDRAADPSQTVRIKVAAPEARCRKAAEAAGSSEKDGHRPSTRLLLQSIRYLRRFV